MTFKLDVKDKKIIHQLELDGRLHLSKISKNIGISKEVCHYRFNRLLDSKLITKFETLINYFNLNYKTYRLHINLESLKEGIRDEIANEFRKNKDITVTLFLQGMTDLEFLINVKHDVDFIEIYEKFMEKYGNYISDKKISIVVESRYLGHRFLYGKQVNQVFKRDNSYNLDNIDEKLLNILIKNPRLKIIEIASKLNLKSNSTIYRYKKINSLVKIIPILDMNLLGYNTYRVEMTLSDPKLRKRLSEIISKNMNVVRINHLIGTYDLEFEVDYETSSELDKFLEKLRIEENSIKDFNVLEVVRN